MGGVGPGETYVNQYFGVVGELSSSIETAKGLVNSTFQDVWSENDLPASEVKLVFSDQSFSLSASNKTCATATTSCTGFSTPHNETSPMFLVICGNESYVGPDQYHFAPAQIVNNETVAIRPYICNESLPALRPSWRLLGYFAPEDCPFDQSLELNLTLCSL